MVPETHAALPPGGINYERLYTYRFRGIEFITAVPAAERFDCADHTVILTHVAAAEAIPLVLGAVQFARRDA